MRLVTNYIIPDEPCFGLFEGPCMVPNLLGISERWVQDIKVIRGDRIHHYVTDLGPASEYPTVQPLMMPSLGDDSVAQLQEYADRNRQDDYWAKRSEEMLAESTLIQDHVNQREEIREIVRNRSVFGPMHTTQRNEYPQQAVWRKWFEERAEKTGKKKGYTRG